MKRSARSIWGYERDTDAYTDRLMSNLADAIASHIAWHRDMAETGQLVLPAHEQFVMEMLYRFDLQTHRGW